MRSLAREIVKEAVHEMALEAAAQRRTRILQVAGITAVAAGGASFVLIVGFRTLRRRTSRQGPPKTRPSDKPDKPCGRGKQNRD